MPKHIKITGHFGAYNPGEVAMFDDEIADQIVSRNLGVEVQVDVKPAKSKAGKNTDQSGAGSTQAAGDDSQPGGAQ